jgi:hypothetical protein
MKIFQQIPEQHTWKARRKGTMESRHIGHGAQASKSAKVKVQMYIERNVHHALLAP